VGQLVGSSKVLAVVLVRLRTLAWKRVWLLLLLGKAKYDFIDNLVGGMGG